MFNEKCCIVPGLILIETNFTALQQTMSCAKCRNMTVKTQEHISRSIAQMFIKEKENYRN